MFSNLFFLTQLPDDFDIAPALLVATALAWGNSISTLTQSQLFVLLIVVVCRFCFSFLLPSDLGCRRSCCDNVISLCLYFFVIHLLCVVIHVFSFSALHRSCLQHHSGAARVPRYGCRRMLRRSLQYVFLFSFLFSRLFAIGCLYACRIFHACSCMGNEIGNCALALTFRNRR